jgi:hypothetical protein
MPAGGKREGSGRKKLKLNTVRSIRNLYRFSKTELDKIHKAVKILQKEDERMTESQFVRDSAVSRAEKIIGE